MRDPENRSSPVAVVITVGTELAEGLRSDTNGPEISRLLAAAGYLMAAREVLPDDRSRLSERISSHLGTVDLLVLTGGLGPTHDDVTREAAADALGMALEPDPTLRARLEVISQRHSSPKGRAQVMRQAQTLPGARIFNPSIGTAPGQLVRHGSTSVLLLPGPPAELRPMLADALKLLDTDDSPGPRILRCANILESDAQVAAERALESYPGIALTVLATPALLDVVLVPRGASVATLEEAVAEVAEALGPACYSTDGASLAEVVVRGARALGVKLALAESCTGGLLSGEITSVPGASEVFSGGFVTYSDALKVSALGVSEQTLRDHGAVSEAVAREMAAGAMRATGADLALAITGVAGPGGGSAEKPVGCVWFSLDDRGGTTARQALFHGDRSGVRARATVMGLDLLRRSITQELPAEV